MEASLMSPGLEEEEEEGGGGLEEADSIFESTQPTRNFQRDSLLLDETSALPNLESGLTWTSVTLPPPSLAPGDSTQCTFCFKKFSNRGSMMRHMRDQHLQPNNTVTCDICGKVCKNRNCLITHRSVAHHGKKKIPRGHYSGGTLGSQKFSTQNVL